MLDIFLGALLFLSAAIIAAPLAHRFGLGSVLGYLMGGVLLSPALVIAGIDALEVQHFTEFGVVLMLFLIGLELQPSKLWDMRGQLVGFGGLQMGGTILLMFGLASLVGLPWQTALAVGMILCLSSTAIALQSMQERGLLGTEGGSASFAVLLMQDVAVIPILALLPLLVIGEPLPQEPGEHAAHGADFMAGLPGWATGLVTAGSVILVILGGRFGVKPLLRLVASVRLRESLTAAALFLVIGIAALMTSVGLSPALGAFLAGMVLADSEFRVELEANIEPFKGLLMGAFFVSVGAGIDFALLMEDPAPILTLLTALIAGKGLVLYGVARLFRLAGSDRWLFILGLAQAGEFAFVLIGMAQSGGVLEASLSDELMLAVALSMLLTPLAFIVHQKLFVDRPDLQTEARDADPIEALGPVIIAGIGRFGQLVERMLSVAGHQTIVLDVSPSQLDVLERFGVKAYFGDATRPEMLEAAGAGRASVFIAAIDDAEGCVRMVEHVRAMNPMCWIIARARDRVHYYHLRRAGANEVIRELAGSSYDAAASALMALGDSPAYAARIRKTFTDHDQSALEDLYAHWDANKELIANTSYVSRARALRAELIQILEEDEHLKNAARDSAERP